MAEISRRDFVAQMGLAASSIALVEMGLSSPARAESAFTIATTGGSWGQAIDQAFVKKTEFEKTIGSKVVYSYQNDSVAVSKIIAQCGNAPFTTAGIGSAEGAALASAGCVQDYDLDLVPNYNDLGASSRLPAEGGLRNYFGSHISMMFAVGWNTKLATRPTTYRDLWSSKYKGMVGIPGFGWQGSYWLYAVNRVFGGNDDDLTPGFEAIAELVKKNDALVFENTDQGMKAFTSEEVVIAPFWNGRIFVLQENKVPVDMAYLPGTVERGSGFLIARGTPFAKEANILVNLTLDPDLQVSVTKSFGYPPTNLKAKLPPDMAHYAVSEKDRENVLSLSWTKINEKRAENLARWNREVLGT